jgi:hypothetical protein
MPWFPDFVAETGASTRVGSRAVLELVAHLARDGQRDGHEVSWPLAVVAESPDDRSVAFRTDCSQWPVDGRRHVRSAIPEPQEPRPVETVGRFERDAAGLLASVRVDDDVEPPVGG